MEESKITKEQRALLGLMGQALFSAPFTADPDVDWRAVMEESRLQSVVALAFQSYSSLPIGEENAALLKPYMKKCALSGLNSFKGHAYLHALLTKHGIPYCILKGVASAQYYKEPLLRSMGDIDFYVPPAYLTRALDVLTADGFSWNDVGDYRHVPLTKDLMHLELHTAPIGLEVGGESQREIFLEYWSDICERGQLKNVGMGECVLPSDFHHGFIQLAHFRKHFVYSGVGLRHVCDWAVFANSFSDEEFVKFFEAPMKRVGLWRLAQILSLSAARHLGMPYRPWMGEEYEVADELFEEVMHVGNFGESAEGRGYENLFISYGSGRRRSRIVCAVKSMNRMVSARWPFAKRCPLLYPFGWGYVSLRFLVKVLRGQRKINVAKAYREGGRRVKLYQRLGFLDGEQK